MVTKREVKAHAKNVDKLYQKVLSLFGSPLIEGDIKLDLLSKKSISDLKAEVTARIEVLNNSDIDGWEAIKEARQFMSDNWLEIDRDSVYHQMDRQCRELFLYLQLPYEIGQELIARRNISKWQELKAQNPDDYIRNLKRLVEIVETVKIKPISQLRTVCQGLEDYPEVKICYGIESDDRHEYEISIAEQILNNTLWNDDILYMLNRPNGKRAKDTALRI